MVFLMAHECICTYIRTCILYYVCFGLNLCLLLYVRMCIDGLSGIVIL